MERHVFSADDIRCQERRQQQKWHLNVTVSTSDWMERHVFPADDNRCQVRRQPKLRAGTNHTGRLLQIVTGTRACLAVAHCRLNLCLQFVCGDIRRVVWRKFHFCCGTAVSCYMCAVNYSVFVLLRILFYIYACLVCFIQLRKTQRRVGVVHRSYRMYDSVTIFFISS
jgi:hypothetical protein